MKHQKTNFTTKEASAYLEAQGVPHTPGTLEVMRCLRRGPAFKKIGRRVFYTKESLDYFLEGRIVQTSDSLGD